MGTTGRPLRTTRQVGNLRERPGWYRIKNVRRESDGMEITQVSIYDEIGMLGVSADDLLRDLAGVEGDIELHLNSPGGDVFDGIAIYNQLKQRKGVVAVVVDGLAASAASFIAQAASPGHLGMAPHSQMMIHDGFGMAIGNAGDMRQMADLLDKASDNIARIYAGRTGKPADYWRERMRAETWLDDHEAVAEGLADHVVGQEGPRNAWDLSVYLHAPVVVNADGTHAPMTGNHSHAHPAFGGPDVDGDGVHGHDHGHNADNSHHPRTDLHEHTAGMGGEDGTPSGMHSRAGQVVNEGSYMHNGHERYDPDNDGDCDACAEGDTDHDYVLPDGSPGPAVTGARAQSGTAIWNEKYSADDRKRMAANGQAMDDGSYPIADEEDLNKAVRSVGRGGSDHDAIRRHIIKRAKALGHSDAIPENWNADGSIGDLTSQEIWNHLATALEGSV